jgi:hypothetical protein
MENQRGEDPYKQQYGQEQPVMQNQPQPQNMSEQVKQSLQDFSSPEMTGTNDQSFLQSNGIIANFAFLVLVLVAFLLLMNLGIYMMNYFLQPTKSPYIVKGMLNGDTFYSVPRDPMAKKHVILQHSNNRAGGIEFTWSLWLSINSLPSVETDSPYGHIFSVGTNNFNKDGISSGSNGPGLYLRKINPDETTVTTANALLLMDTMSPAEKSSTSFSTLSPGNTTTNSTEVTNLPYKKWFHMAIRMQNQSMDIYINGTITNRVNFENVPKQNYQDVLVCANGGFPGQISNLRYYDYALSVFEIMNLVYWGPNLKLVEKTTESSSSNYNFLSNEWYNSKL